MTLSEYLRDVSSQTQLARQLGVTQGAVSQWLSRGVPAARVLEIEAATDRMVTRGEMRPDLYPDEAAA